MPDGGSGFWPVFDISRNPCARTSLMWGIVTGTVAGFHGWRTRGTARAMADLAVAMFVCTASMNWVLCTREHNERRQRIKESVQGLQQQQQQRQERPKAAAPPAGIEFVEPQPQAKE